MLQLSPIELGGLSCRCFSSGHFQNIWLKISDQSATQCLSNIFSYYLSTDKCDIWAHKTSFGLGIKGAIFFLSSSHFVKIRFRCQLLVRVPSLIISPSCRKRWEVWSSWDFMFYWTWAFVCLVVLLWKSCIVLLIRCRILKAPNIMLLYPINNPIRLLSNL